MFATNYTNFHELLGEKFVEIRGKFFTLQIQHLQNKKSFKSC